MSDTTIIDPESNMLIDGKLIESSTGETFDNINPATEEVIGQVTDGSAEDMRRAISADRRVRTGTISVNGGLWYGADVPFGGFKDSMVGRQNGIAGFDQYLEIQSLAWPSA